MAQNVDAFFSDLLISQAIKLHQRKPVRTKSQETKTSANLACQGQDVDSDQPQISDHSIDSGTTMDLPETDAPAIPTDERNIPPHLTIFRTHSMPDLINNLQQPFFGEDLDPMVYNSQKKVQIRDAQFNAFLARLVQERLRNLRFEELDLIQKYKKRIADRLSPPMPYWYELCDSRFHDEYRKNGNYLKCDCGFRLAFIKALLNLDELKKVAKDFEILMK